MSGEAGPSGENYAERSLCDVLYLESENVGTESTLIPIEYQYLCDCVPRERGDNFIARFQKNNPREPIAATVAKVDVANFLATLPAADTDAYLRVKKYIHEIDHFADADFYKSKQWVAVAYLCVCRFTDFGADNSLDALKNILEVNDCSSGTWPERLVNVGQVPKLSQQLTKAPSCVRGVSWVEDSQLARQALTNPAIAQVVYTAALPTVTAVASVAQSSGGAAGRPSYYLSDVLFAAEQQAALEANSKKHNTRLAKQQLQKGPLAATPANIPDTFAEEDEDPLDYGLSGSDNLEEEVEAELELDTAEPMNLDTPVPPKKLPPLAPAKRTIRTGIFGSDTPVSYGPFFPPERTTQLPVSYADAVRSIPVHTVPLAESRAPSVSFAGFPRMSTPELPEANLPGLIPPVAKLPATSRPSAFVATGIPSAPAHLRQCPAGTTQTLRSPALTKYLEEIRRSKQRLTGGLSAGSGLVEELYAQISVDPAKIKALLEWSSGPMGSAGQPREIKDCTVTQIEQLLARMEPWFAIMRPGTPSANVSPTPLPPATSVSGDTIGVFATPESRKSVMTMPAETQPFSGFPSASTPLSVFQNSVGQLPPTLPRQNPGVISGTPMVSGMSGSVLGGGRSSLKLPSPPTFKGDSQSMNPKTVRHFLRCMDLALKQARPVDPVLTAVNYLTDQAADWRDTVFLPKFPSDYVIPWMTFERELLARFVPQVACMDALKDFRKLHMTKEQSVQEFNAIFRQRRLELISLPHITIPDTSSQVETYLTGLRASISGVLSDRVDPTKLNDLDYLMNLAEVAETVAKQMTMILDKKGADHSGNSHPNYNSHKRNNLGSSDAQKRKISSPSVQSSGRSQKKGKSSSGKGPATPGKSSGALVAEINQHPGNSGLHARLLSASELQSLRSQSAKSIKGTDGQMYPNKQYRIYGKRNCQALGLCYGCFGKDTHPRGHCPNPEVSSYSSELSTPVTASVGLTQMSPAQSNLVEARDGSGNPLFCTAMVHAKPYLGVTMLFAGAVQEGELTKDVNVLVDTGSSHNICRPGLMDMTKSTGKLYAVSVAGSDTLSNVPEGQIEVKVQGITTKITACEMQLPDGVDILLGQTWQTPHKATLLTWSGQVNFMDDDNVPACWSKQKKLSDNPFNSPLKWTSAASVGKAKQHFVCFVRAASDRPQGVSELIDSFNFNVITTEQSCPVNTSDLQQDKTCCVSIHPTPVWNQLLWVL